MTMEMDVDVTEDHTDETSELKSAKGQSPKKDLIIDQFTDGGRMYDLYVKPMLQRGHEKEFYNWLKEVNLIRSEINCPSEGCNNKSLTWVSARCVDRYGWLCTDCKKRQSIKDNSIFFPIKCDMKISMQIIVAWCQSMPIEVVATYLELKHYIVKKAYEQLAKVVETYVTNHLDEWILGGEGKILIVDEFPSGYMTETLIDAPITKRRNNNCHTILCIAEVENIPPRMWIHIINANPEPAPPKSSKTTKQETKNGTVEDTLNEITSTVSSKKNKKPPKQVNKNGTNEGTLNEIISTPPFKTEGQLSKQETKNETIEETSSEITSTPSPKTKAKLPKKKTKSEMIEETLNEIASISSSKKKGKLSKQEVKDGLIDSSQNETTSTPSKKNVKSLKQEARCGMVEEALNEICAHAKPGSFIIANKRARCCNYESLKELKQYTVISIDDLKVYDTPGKSELLCNLETIWQTGVGICEEIQDITRTLGLSQLYVYLWRQRFATSTATAFQNIIQQIAECYPFAQNSY